MSLLIGINCQMIKLKQFSNEFDLLFKEKRPWIGVAQCLKSSDVLCTRDLGQAPSFPERRGNVETGHDWLEGQGFPYKDSRSHFFRVR